LWPCSPLVVPELFVPGFDPLIQRLQHTRVHGGVEFFLGHTCFPCVRKAAFDSGIAKAHHRQRQTHEHFLAVGEAFDRIALA